VTLRRLALSVLAVLALTGCAHTTIEPGHRGLLFDPSRGGLQSEVLAPGVYRVGGSARVEDFDVTYSTRHEKVGAISSEGLSFELVVGVIYRPIIAELYALDTEIGPAYYDEVVGPEARSAIRGVVARTSFTALIPQASTVEDAIEREIRARVAGKHVEIASVVVEKLDLPPEVAAAMRRRALEKAAGNCAVEGAR
jgi:regulator of protease activity HflC (stomatin/prohibitin superfamily)